MNNLVIAKIPWDTLYIPKPLHQYFEKNVLESYFATAEKYDIFPDLDCVSGDIPDIFDTLFNYDCSIADGKSEIDTSYSEMEREQDRQMESTEFETYLYQQYQDTVAEATVVVLNHYKLVYKQSEYCAKDEIISPIVEVW